MKTTTFSIFKFSFVFALFFRASDSSDVSPIVTSEFEETSRFQIAIGDGSEVDEETSWSQIAIGGGGYVLQTFFHPDGEHVYMKTDVGGAYRRIASPNSPGGFAWIPMLDWAGPDQGGYYSVSALAMAPENGANLMILSGAYWAYSNCSVLLSTDAGVTWSVAPGSKGWGMKCGGNENDRAVGDRMSMHPTIAGLVAVGGSDGGVYISVDAFASTLPVRVNLPSPAQGSCNPDKNNTCVVRNVLWLTTSSGITILIAAVPSIGLFASSGPDFTDASTYSFVVGSGGDATLPSDINRIAVTGEPGELWLTCGKGGVWKGTLTTASGASSSWQVKWDINGALSEQDVSFSGIAIKNAGKEVVVMSMLYDNNTTLFRSIDSGATFVKLNWTCTSSVPWWGQNDFNTNLNAASSLSFDPNTGQLWATDFFGVYVADDLSDNSTQISFQNVETGHEEVCMNTIREPVVGSLLTGAADVGGWVHDNGVNTWPSSTFKAADGWAHNCLFSIDFTLSLSPNDKSADAVWVTAGELK
jgi:xyloglucan-specific exo-beta-1,4-glucanase